MNINIKPHILISHLLPGSFFLILFSLDYNSWKMENITNCLEDLDATKMIGLGVILIIISFLLGEIFDSFRDGIGEWLLDKIDEVTWDYFYTAPKEELQKLESSYFTWYVFNFNTAVSLLVGGVITLIFFHGKVDFRIGVAWFLAIFILAFDAWQLRKEVAKHTK